MLTLVFHSEQHCDQLLQYKVEDTFFLISGISMFSLRSNLPPPLYQLTAM